MNAVSSYAGSTPGAAPPWAQKHPLHFTYDERKAYRLAHHGRIPPELLGQGGCRKLARPALLPVLERLSQNDLGACYATESALRGMLWEDMGGFPFGARTISRCLRKENERGAVVRRRYPRGHIFTVIDFQSPNGTTTNRLPSVKERNDRLFKERMAKRAQRKQRARAEKMLRREPAAVETPSRARAADEPRTGLPLALSAFDMRLDFFKSPPPAEPIGVAVEGDDDFEARKARALKRAREWMIAEGEKPPD